MCGGSGTRLWPASRPDRPKQFIPLVGDRSSFQETALRVAPLGELVIVAGVSHRAFLEEQLAAVGLTGSLILEVEGRDSAAAMAAAAAFVQGKDPDGICVFVAADHHIPDHDTFREACRIGVSEAGRGRIVTLGVRPTWPATAYGYIEAASPEAAVSPVRAFVEKPDAATAQAYIDRGFLWNSGNFIAGATTLLGEIEAFIPDVARAARDGVLAGERDGAALTLGQAFLKAPKISIDFGVMEKTAKASVAPVAFAWTDIGAWDAVRAASPRDADGNAGPGMFIDARNNLVRSSGAVALVGVEGLAVIVESGAVLVADLAKAQAVKAVGEAMKSASSTGRPVPFATLSEARGWFDRWMTASALPLWWSLGADHVNGGFREELDLAGGNPPRRGRVQPRQAYAFATAGAAGWTGPWRAAAEHGLAFMRDRQSRPDGLVRALVDPAGAVLDDTARVYDQAFALLAYAALGRESEALSHLAAMTPLRHPAGGWREAGGAPFQSNPHMHMFEAMLAWEKAGTDPRWAQAADEIAELALNRFIDPDRGSLREFFDASWAPAQGDAGRMIEPGHQFEWACLLDQWGAARGRQDARDAARRLYGVGLEGVDRARGVALNGLWDDFAVRYAEARLWVQAEYLKAALSFGDEAEALAAARAVHAYLDDPAPGAWRDLMDENGRLAAGPSPASTLYHLVGAWSLLCRG